MEETLKEMMKADIGLSKDDWRIQAIHSEVRQLYDEDQRSSCISDEEMRAYVEKYFLFNPIVESEMHRTDETTDEGTFHDDLSYLPKELITD